MEGAGRVTAFGMSHLRDPQRSTAIASRITMWKALLNKRVREVRFILKPSESHQGAWNFVTTKLPELRMLNANTNFFIHEISDDFKSPSEIFIKHGDVNYNTVSIPTAGKSASDIEGELKKAVMNASNYKYNNADMTSLPVDVVHAATTIPHLDNRF